jgi:phage shock protein C
MFCSQCGKQIEPNSRFCNNCGAVISSDATPPPPPFAGIPYARTSQLTRPREGRMIAGVCAAFAIHYGWDLNMVRILTVLFIVLTGVGAIAYLAAWVIIPESPYALPANTTNTI